MSRYGDILKISEVSENEVNKLLAEGWMLLDMRSAPFWKVVYIVGMPATFKERREQIKALMDDA
ncbi:MAG: hypothetical protein HY619_07860 [Thaumarchaeota archaeon]|nr:hypothetical protein [Nitrososphaerota archaeon]